MCSIVLRLTHLAQAVFGASLPPPHLLHSRHVLILSQTSHFPFLPVVVVRLHLRVVLLDALFALMKRAEVGVPELLTVPTAERVNLAGTRSLEPEERKSLERAFRMRGLLVATLKYALSKLNVKAVMEEMVRGHNVWWGAGVLLHRRLSALGSPLLAAALRGLGVHLRSPARKPGR